MEIAFTPYMIFDLLCLALVVITAVRFAGKGMLASVVEVVGTLASLLGARLVSGWAAPQIFDSLFASGLKENIHGYLATAGQVDVAGVLDQFAGFLPASVVSGVLDPLQGQLENALAGNLESTTTFLMENVLEPLLVPLVAIVLFFVTFALLRMAVSLVSNVLTAIVNHIPLIGQANKGLGFVAGAVVGLLYLFLVLCGIWALITITGGRLPMLDDALLTNSIFYRIFGAINPFVG